LPIVCTVDNSEGHVIKIEDSLLLLSGELEVDVLAGQSSVDGREGVELVLEEVGVLGVKEAREKQHIRPVSYEVPPKGNQRKGTNTRVSLEPSVATRVLLPVISEG
jgi:hypothetical protein